MSITIAGTVAQFTLPKSGTWYVDIDMDSIDNNIQLLTIVNYASSAGTTGVTVDLIAGFGGPDPSTLPTSFPCVSSATGATVPVFADNSQSVTMQTVTASQTSSKTYKTSFYLDSINVKWPRWVRLRFINLDATYPASITLLGDA